MNRKGHDQTARMYRLTLAMAVPIWHTDHCLVLHSKCLRRVRWAFNTTRRLSWSDLKVWKHTTNVNLVNVLFAFNTESIAEESAYYRSSNWVLWKYDCALTLCSLETPKRVFGKQCRPRSDAAERGAWSGSPLFANNSPFFLWEFRNRIAWHT